MLNARKSVAFRISSRYNCPCASLSLSGSVLEHVNKAKYLGVMLVSGRTFRCCFDHVKSKFYGSFNTIVHKVENAASELVCVLLLKSVCLPVILYALEAFSVTRTAINTLDDLINRAIYRMFNCTTQDNILYIRSSMFNFLIFVIWCKREHRHFCSLSACCSVRWTCCEICSWTLVLIVLSFI